MMAEHKGKEAVKQTEKIVADGKGPVLPPDDLLALSPVWSDEESNLTEIDRGGEDPRRTGKKLKSDDM